MNKTLLSKFFNPEEVIERNVSSIDVSMNDTVVSYMYYTQPIPKDIKNFDELDLLFIFMVPEDSLTGNSHNISLQINQDASFEPWLLTISFILLFSITAMILTYFGRKLSFPINLLTQYTNDLRQAPDTDTKNRIIG